MYDREVFKTEFFNVEYNELLIARKESLMCEEILNRCSVTFFLDEGAEGKEYKCTPVHIISSFVINGDLWGFEGEKVHDILHEGCGMGMHWHSIVLLPSHDDGTPVVQNRSVINRYYFIFLFF